MEDTPLTPRFEVRIPPSMSSYIIVALMMGLVTHAIITTGQRLLPFWQTGFLPWIAVVISLESIFSSRQQRDLYTFTPEWVLHLVTEWVVILVTIKAILMVSLGQPIINELSQWRDRFIDSFFSSDYILAVVVLLFIWLTSRFFASFLFNLEEDYGKLDTERNGIGVLDRSEVRRQLMGLIFILGGFLLLLMAFNRIDLPIFKLDLPGFQVRALDTILYFVLGFLLLGLSQYSLLRIRWYLNKVPVQQKNILGWITATLILLALVGLVISFLPTHYSIGLLAILNAIVNVVMVIIGFIGYLLTLPLAWLAHLLLPPGRQMQTQSMPSLLATPEPGARPMAAPIPWIEWLKSVLFWGILLAVIGYSIYHYLQQRKDLLEVLEQYRAWRWLKQIGLWIKSLFGSAGQQAAKVIQAIAKIIRSTGQAGSRQLVERILNIGRLGNRDKVLQTYLHMVDWTSDNGIPRRTSETPLEYAEKVKTEVPPAETDLQSLTGEFMEARYSQHEITETHSQSVQKYWEAIKAFVLQSKQSTPHDQDQASR